MGSSGTENFTLKKICLSSLVKEMWHFVVALIYFVFCVIQSTNDERKLSIFLSHAVSIDQA